MQISDSGRAPWRIFGIQILIISALIISYRLYLPRRARQQALHAAAAREESLNAFFHDSVMEDPSRLIPVPQDGTIAKRHPQRLRATFSPQEAESRLGVPDASMTDFRGGQHLTWIGTAHKLEAAFDAGHLYYLAVEDRKTGHGVMVYESLSSWHPY